MASTYRRDIDGMRGVAILLVVLHHAHVSGFEAGYLGVDMFFVISGYVITGAITPLIVKERFSFADFFIRRVRRLFPALYAMLLGVMVFSVFLLNNLLYQQAIQTVFATNLFLSNVYLLIESIGAATPGQGMLLHTWSLGVEAQFYLCMPLFLMACLPTFGLKRTAQFIFVGSILSLLGYCYLQSIGQWDTAFYLLPTRMWELGMGSCLALYPKWFESKHLDCQAVLGLLLFMVSLWWGEDRYRLGVANVAMCLASVLMIVSSIRTHVSKHWLKKILEHRPLVLLGLISYSLYLWHYPIFRLFDPEATWVGIALGSSVSVWVPIIVSVILAMLSWHLIEQPVRMQRVLSHTKHLIAFFTFLFVLCFTGSLLLLSQIKDVPMGLEGAEERWDSACRLQEEGVMQCPLFGALATRMLVIGDDYVGMYLPLLLDLAKQYRVNLDIVTLRGCSLVVNPSIPWSSGFARWCEKQRMQQWSVIKRISQQRAYAGLLWAEQPPAASQTSDMKSYLFSHLTFLSRHFKHVWLVLPPPMLDQMVHWHSIKPEWRAGFLHALFDFGPPKNLVKIPLVVDQTYPKDALSKRLVMHVHQDLKGLFVEAARTFGPVRFLDPTPLLCADQKACEAQNKQGHLLYNIISRHALSYQGVVILRSMFEPIFQVMHHPLVW